MKTNYRWAARGWLSVVQLMGTCRKNAFEIAQIYGATTYLKGVQLVRDLFLYQMGILAAVVLLVFGLILMEIAALVYVPLTPSVRCMLAFILGGIHVVTGIIFLGYLVSSKRWLEQASKYNAWLKSSLEEEEPLNQKKERSHAESFR